MQPARCTAGRWSQVDPPVCGVCSAVGPPGRCLTRCVLRVYLEKPFLLANSSQKPHSPSRCTRRGCTREETTPPEHAPCGTTSGDTGAASTSPSASRLRQGRQVPLLQCVIGASMGASWVRDGRLTRSAGAGLEVQFRRWPGGSSSRCSARARTSGRRDPWSSR